MPKRTLIRTLERAYLKLPISHDMKRRARDVVFTYGGAFFDQHPAYQIWKGRHHQNAMHDELLWEKLGKFPAIKAPSENDWYLLAQQKRSRTQATPTVDVIIPVYDGYDETLRAIFHACAAENHTPHEIIVISDCGPNKHLNEQLERLASHGLFTLLTNQKNLGFVQTVNRGFALHPDRDVLILNADAFVYGDYLDRMLAHAKHGKVATVTPLTNNGEICSYPLLCRNNSWQLELDDEALDALAVRVNKGAHVTIPTGVGFCMLITRAALNDTGTFNADAFGKGYGEENDFCVRATEKGYTHLLAGDAFVRHAGGVSFSHRKQKAIERAMKVMEKLHPGYNTTIRDYLAKEPAKTLRQKLDMARLHQPVDAHKPAMLFVFHTWGGGTEKHARDMARWLEQEGVNVYTLKPIEGKTERCQLGHFGDKADIFTPNLEFDVKEEAALTAALRELGVAHMHIHHLVGYDNAYYTMLPHIAQQLGAAFDITVHDYFPICPRINLINETGRYCGEPEVSACNNCVKKNGSAAGEPEVGAWRTQHGALFAKARRVFVPDEDVAARLKKYFATVAFHVRAHPEIWHTTPHAASPQQDSVRRVALIGALFELKGAKVLKALVQDAHARKLPIEYHLIGYYGMYDPEIYTYPNFRFTGKYKDTTVGELIAASGATIALFPAVWPETFSYTLSLAYQHGLYPVSFDLGAPSTRIRACDWGTLWPLAMMDNPQHMNDALLTLTPPVKPETLAIYRKEDLYPSLLADYYQLAFPTEKKQVA